VQVDVRVLSPNAEDNAWRRPYPLGRTHGQRERAVAKYCGFRQ
jgi:hypothetical protein